MLKAGSGTVFTREGTAEHVLERFEPVTPPGQQDADRGVGQVGQFDLHGGTAGGEGLLDSIESSRIRHASEAEPGDLVVRRTLPGEAGHAARNRDRKARRACPAAGGLAALGDELDLCPLDAPGQGGIAEQRLPPGVHTGRTSGCSLRRHQAPSAVFARIDMGVPALHGHLIAPIAHDHPGPPGHHRGRVTTADRAFPGVPGHLGEPQLSGADRVKQFFPVCDLAAQHVNDEEVVGQYRAKQLKIGSKQGGEE